MNIPWSLLILCGLAVLPGAESSPRWLAFSALVWLIPVFYPSDLHRPRGFGAWTMWAAWGGLCALFSGEPLLAAGAMGSRLTGVLLFALCYSLWGRPHQRAYLLGLWTLAGSSGLWALMTGQGRPVATGFIFAALSSCLGALAGPLPESRSWRVGLRILPVLFAGLAAALWYGEGARLGRLAMEGRGVCGASVSVVAGKVWMGAGPGLFSVTRRGSQASAGPEYAYALGETGVTGLVLMLVALGFSLPDFRRGRFSVIREWERRAAAASFFALILFSFAHRIFDSPALLVLWFTALANAAPGEEEEESRVIRLAPSAALAGAVFSLLGILPLRFIEQARSPQADRTQRMRAWRMAPGDATVLVGLAASELQLDPPQWGLALVWLDGAMRAAPGDPLYPFRKAEFYQALGVKSEAGRWAQVALALDPKFEPAREMLQGMRGHDQ